LQVLLAVAQAAAGDACGAHRGALEWDTLPRHQTEFGRQLFPLSGAGLD
jgi:hypothetical protein